MNIDHMRTFLEVAATGSFQLAAGKLYVTQSTVSARIKSLEDQLNRKLFIRNRNGAELTAGGHHFHRHALTAVRAWDRARQEIALPEDLKAIINLGIQLNHLDHISDSWLSWMQFKMPDIATHIVSEYSETLMRSLRDRLLDMAILYDPQQCPELFIEPYMTENLILVSSSQRKVINGRVDGYVFVDWGESFKAQHSMSFQEVVMPKLSVGLSAVGLNHILKYGGSGYFLEQTVKPLIKDERLHLVADAPVFKLPTFLVYQENTSGNDLITTAIEGLRSVAVKLVNNN